MNPEQFKLAEPILDLIADEIDDFFEGKDGNKLRDLCPHCEKGKLSAQNPACDRCGFEVNPNVVHWG